MASDIDRLRVLLQRFHTKTIHITDEQLQLVFDFLYCGKFYPIKLKLPVSKSMVSTILYLKDMATRDGYDSLDKIEHYFKRQRTRLHNMFRDLEK